MTKLTYDEIQSKTIKWCKNLLDNNIYTIENYNKCIDSFSKDKGGIIPDKMEVPRTGVEYNYGMYNRDPEYLDRIEKTTLGSRMMITSHDGKYLGTDKDGKLYHIKNYRDQGINQEELEWSLISHGDNKFSIMSIAYHTYFTSDSNNKVSATSDDMNVSSIWKFKKVDNQTLIESTIRSNYYIHYNEDEDYCVKISEGINEEKMWNFYNISDKNNITDNFDETEYRNNKVLLFDNYVKYKKLNKIIKAEILILQELMGLVKNIFENLETTINNIYDNSRNEMSRKTGRYLREIGELDRFRLKLSNSHISESLFDSYTDQIKELERKIGMKGHSYMSLTHKKNMQKELENQKNKYIVMIMVEIKKRNKLLMDNDELNNAEDKVDEFLTNLKKEVASVDNKLNQNNEIMNKQINQINEIKGHNHFKKSKKNELKDKSHIVDFNTNIVKSKYEGAKKKKNYLIIAIVILLLVIAGLIYYIYYNVQDIYYSGI